ncbi:4Fe-4S binding protein [Roseimicrobium gellanilyticum]
MPTVLAEACTGCGICFDVCPAPRKAVLMLAKKPIPPVG